MPEASAAILGAGAMGTALATVLAQNKYKVTLWDVEKEVVQGISRFHKNPRSLSELTLDVSIKSEADITRAVSNRDMVILAVASSAVREVAGQISGVIPRNGVVVCVSKGLEAQTFKTMHEVVLESLGAGFRYQVATFSGPTFAHELAARKPTAAMLASERSNEYSKRSCSAFSNDWFRVYETRDVLGVSSSGVAKNALALASGIMVGLGYGFNTYSWLLTEGFRELSRLIWKLGGAEQTVYGLAGFGDAIATCFSEQSRNRTFGELLGKGKTISAALQQVGETVEGVAAVEALRQIALKERLNLPILEALSEVVVERKKADRVFKELVRSL
ncbi:MAG: NAD(P)-dependent glycerol-3-phosphate dehydrogenase [Parcubacteria group bacterium]|nr:NAD(P)-dependent glycerol-3-phosphate dehydrogenase [Parcubacteria group bacterium]